MPTLFYAAIAPCSSSTMLAIFSFAHGSAAAARLRDKHRARFQHRIHNAQPIGPQRRTRLGNLHNRVGQMRHLHFRGAPGKFHARVYAVPLQIFLG